MVDRKLHVFLCHAYQDKPIARELYQKLVEEGWIDPWLDEKKLLPGQDWRTRIEEAVESSDVVIICLSTHSVNKEGFVQKELRYAKEIALEKPEGMIFLIPLRLDDCEVPRGLRFYQWTDYFGRRREQSYRDLLASLKLKQSEINHANAKSLDENKERDGQGSSEEGLDRDQSITLGPDVHETITSTATRNRGFNQKPEKEETESNTSKLKGDFVATSVRGKEQESLVKVPSKPKLDLKPIPSRKPLFYMNSTFVSNYLFHLFTVENKDWLPSRRRDAVGEAGESYLEHWVQDRPDANDTDLPVININILAAQAFIVWLGGKTQNILRLPTVVEWQQAAKAGRENWLEEEIREGHVNYFETYGKLSLIDSFAPNPYGIHDLIGNAYNLCATADGNAFDGGIMVGGCHYSTKSQLLEARRVNSPSVCLGTTSFRFVCDLQNPTVKD